MNAMPKEAELPLAPIDRIMRRAGGRRVSASAAQALREIIEDIAVEIAKRAKDIAAHAGRKTVTGADIKLAYSQFMRK